jgi:TonB family protein
VEEKRKRNATSWLNGMAFLVLCFAVTTWSGGVYAQQSPPSEQDATPRRIERARALAAAHNLTAATFELDAILKSATDDAARDVARIMLMGIHLEQADYAKAQTLLDETFKGRIAHHEGSLRSYFALAGQSINGVRAHLERYRAFGIDITDKDLPPEAVNDLDHLRTMLEHVAGQAREMSNEDTRNTDAVALLEDVTSIRGTLARNREERQQWQRESAKARQKLASSDIRIASTRGIQGGLSPAGMAAMSAVNGAGGGAASSAQSSSTERADTSSAPASADTPSSSNKGLDEQSREGSGKARSGDAKQDSQLMDVGPLLDKATKRVSPSYPHVARSQRVTGVVKVVLVIDETGTVASIKHTSGPPLLQPAAAEAARRWKFQPTMVNGQPVRVTGYINFNFAF